MRSQLTETARAAAALTMTMVLSACGGLSDVGKKSTAKPQAQATAVGYAAADASGNVAFDARSQAEVTLTGKLSIKADKPILSYLWEPQNAAAANVLLTVRDQSTVTATVPAVTQPTDLVFKLTVSDSDGNTSSATATLHAQPALDANRFLSYIGNTPRLRVVAATKQAIAAGGACTVSLRYRVTYTTRGGARNTIEVATGGPVSGQWVAALGSGGDSASDYRNPVFDFPVPVVNADDITRTYQKGLPAASDKLLDPAHIDDADVEVVASLDAQALQNAGVLYVVDANGNTVARAENAGTGSPTALTLTPAQVEALRLSGGGLENKATAKSYYKGIDPTDAKTTLRDWLAANCFNPDAGDFGADAHALYTNNFDLGFGRDMYFRSQRPATCASASFRAGDSAAIVINYPTLEAAAKKLGTIIAVGMEYKASAVAGQPGLVTFYAFAPDLAAGGFRRVRSANFDGRGEKYLPGACTTCHGGRPPTPATDPTQTYAASQNIGATFMPWDLESFLYSDTDPAFSRDPADAQLKSQLTRAAQEAQFRKLNLAVHATYGDGATFQCFTGFEGPCELVETWYGGAGLPSATFLNGQIVTGWKAGGVNSNPAVAERIYLDVFARNCRACHTQRVVAAGAAKDPQFRTYADFTRTSQPAWRDKVIEQVFHAGGMPAARLTMDRLWSKGSASSSPGELLAQYLGVPAPAQPKLPLACITSETGPTLSTDSTNRTALQRHSVQSLSGSCSDQASAFHWTLTPPSGSQSVLVGSTSGRASFVADKPGNYDVSVQVTGPDGSSQSSLQQFAFVQNLLPQAAASIAVTVDLNSATTVDVLSKATALGDLPTTVTSPTLVSGSGLTASLDSSSRVVVTATGVAGGTLRYSLVDVDGDTSSGTIVVSVAATLTANNATPAAVDAYSNQTTRPTYEIPLTPLVAAQGQPVTYSIASGPVFPGRRDGTTGLVNLAPCTTNTTQTCALYSPPQAAVSVFNGTAIGPDDSFVYKACFTLQPSTCATGTITMKLRGRFDFAAVESLQRGTCFAGCHGTDQTALGANWMISGPTTKDAYCAIRFKTGIAPDPADVGVPIVNVTNPAASLLFIKPQGGNNHGGGTVLTVGSAGLAAIRNWIDEGGYYTAGNTQTCP